MSSSADYTDSDLRECFEEVAVSGNGKANKRLHVPDEDGEPICASALQTKQWRLKSVDVYPPDWFEWCERCREALQERDDVEAKVEATDTPEWVLTGDAVAGDACVVDW